MFKNTNKKKLLILSSIFILAILCFATFNISANCVTTPYPDGKYGHSMIYDPINDVVIVYGGTVGEYDLDRKYDTRAYDYNNNNWTNLNPIGHPSGSSWGAMAYDIESEKIVHFGGIPQNGYASNETWIYDPSLNTWTKADPNDYPEMRGSNAMAYDSEFDVVILHGGNLFAEENPDGGYVHYNDTWAYDFNTDTWTDMSPTGLTVGVVEAQMTYDLESDKCIMVGGFFEYPYSSPQDEYFSDETWAYDYNTNTWENITTTIHPSIRIDHALAYDTESDRIILTGGHKIPTSDAIMDETWSFDYNTQTWENMNPATKPKRIAHQMAYDSESDRVIMFGGISEPGYANIQNTIFVYDYNTNIWEVMSSEICTTTPPDDGSWYFAPVIVAFSIISAIVILRRRNK